MKTIEERAWEKYPEVIKHHNLVQIDINEKKRKMYIEIATEQKAIDNAELLKGKKKHKSTTMTKQTTSKATTMLLKRQRRSLSYDAECASIGVQ